MSTGCTSHLSTCPSPWLRFFPIASIEASVVLTRSMSPTPLQSTVRVEVSRSGIWRARYRPCRSEMTDGRYLASCSSARWSGRPLQ